MREYPVLLDGLRTPFGRFQGALSGCSTRQLNAAVIRALLARQPALATCDGVLLGQVLQAAQGQNPARLAASEAGLPWTTPAATVNAVCPAGLVAVADACRRIHLREGSLYVVGGGDSMSRAPHAGVLRPGLRGAGDLALTDTLIRDGLWCGIGDEGMGPVSERANVELGISREVQDEIALRSHRLAGQATREGWLAGEILPLDTRDSLLSRDEGIRDTTPEKLAKLKPAFVNGGSITSGNASQMSDGAAIGVLASADRAEALGAQPLARVIAWAETAGPDNTLHLKPADAVQRVLERAGGRLADIDLFEINEAFAGVVEASRARLGIPLDIVNVHGGAIAIGHPLGGTGFRLLLTLARALERSGGRYGIAALCGGGGQGHAVLIENARRA